MFKNYIKIAWRNIIRNKISSIINISGLAIGLAVAMVIALWMYDEISFNHYHKNHGTIAQVMDTQTFNGETYTKETIAIPLANELRNKYVTDFKHIVLAFPNYTHILAVGDKKIAQPGIWTQPELLEMLGLNMLKGNRNALNDPSSVLLTQSLAQTLFGNDDPMGKTIKLDNMAEVKVGGVFEDLPRNSSFAETKLFLAWDKAISTFGGGIRESQTEWDTRGWNMFVQLNNNIDINKLNEKIRGISQPHIKDGKEEILLQPMDKWHLYSEFKNGKNVGGRIRYVWMFGIVGLFVLLLACINFINLSTAKTAKRAKEVGIRKAIGSLRFQLVGQFLSESLLVVLLSFLLSLVLVQISLPFFNSFAQKTISIPYSNPLFLLSTLAFTVFTGLVAGIYPAFYLSSFNPVKVLKGTLQLGRFATLPRKVLVVVQFTVSIALMIGTAIVFRQLQFAKNRPVGYSRAGLIEVLMNTPDILGAHYNAIRNDLLQTGVVENMAESSSTSTKAPETNKGFDWKGKEPGSVPQLGAVDITHDFGKTIGWKITRGRDFSRDFTTDSSAVILNESAASLMGLPSPIGETIKWNGTAHVITGVVKDMVMESPFKPIQPTIFLLDYHSFFNFITLRIKPNVPVQDALAKIETVFKKYNPASPFTFQFTDEEYARKFADEEEIGKLATVFAVLAIFISCLGLFGLSAFMAEQRTKEIGVRKVLGASIFNVWQLLSKEFVVLIIISLLIAAPTAYYFMHNWLQQYEYRTTISFWIFIVVGIGAFLITLLTVSFQAIKAAVANPVKSLRTE